MRRLVAARRIARDALGHFNMDDGWAIASHVAMSVLLALFPFLIFVASLASFIGSEQLVAQAVAFIFDLWPESVAAPVAREVTSVLTGRQGGLLTVGLVLSIWLASNGVEALRVALNRAYRQVEERSFFWRRAQSLIFVVLGAAGLLSLSFLVALAPIVWSWLVDWFPFLAPFGAQITVLRLAITICVLIFLLFAAHLWLPGQAWRIRDYMPGILFTLFFWFVAALAFGAYLESFANYAATFAGLASLMTALIFLYLIAVILILGAELNAALRRYRDQRERVGAETMSYP